MLSPLLYRSCASSTASEGASCTASEVGKRDRARVQKMQFDADLFPIGVGTYSSRCMSNDLDHYDDYEPFKKGGKVIVADGGTIEIKGKEP